MYIHVLHVYESYSTRVRVLRGPHQDQAKIGDLDASRKRTKERNFLLLLNIIINVVCVDNVFEDLIFWKLFFG